VIPELIAGQVVFVAGPVASGKTYLLRQWALREKHVIFFDTAGDHLDETNFEHIWASPSAFMDRIDRARSEEVYRIAYHPQDVETGFDWVVTGTWQLDHPRFLFIEEVHEVMSPWTQHPKMKLLNKYARKREALGVITCSQRLADVHKDLTSAARLCVLFQTFESKDLDAIRERWGDEVEGAVRGLRSLQYDDATRATLATPQAVVIKRGVLPALGGKNWEVIDVG
jgi:hypothetical protein